MEQNFGQPAQPRRSPAPWRVAAVCAAIALLVAGCVFLAAELLRQRQANADLQELAELDKAEMEDQYRQFDIQYGELRKQLRNDSLIAQIDAERERAQRLLAELEQTKATDAREITRLKREIQSLRAVLKSYIVQVDSLNRANETLRAENTEFRQQVSDANTQISHLSSERTQLLNVVDRAAQLDATAFWVQPKNKRGKNEKRAKDTKRIAIGFTIARNVTAQGGPRTLYARILKPDNSVYNPQGRFPYEDSQIDYSEAKTIEYDGEEQSVTVYSDVSEFLDAGTYKIYVFADGQMIGSSSFTLQ